MLKQRLFLLLLLMSGFAGISYEILYGRILGNLIGDQFAVSAAILITFLLGIGVGSRYAWRLWSWLWLIELLIGLCGAAFAFGTGPLDTLLYTSLPLLPSGLTGSIIACIFLLLFPAFLIGCSVPLFAGYMSRLSSGADFSKVYAIYNFGAALTALLIEYLMLRLFGLEGAVLGFVALNLFIAAVLRFAYVLPQPQIKAPTAASALPWRWRELIPISMASAIFQLLMVKLAEMLLGPFRESFALVLSIVLLGIALGSLLVRRFELRFQSIVLLCLAGLLLFIASMEPVAYLYAQLYEPASEYYFTIVLLKWGCLFLLMGLPAVAFGATVPALISADGEHVSRESGQLLFVASMANVVGFLLMVFVLHRYLDYGVIVLVISVLTAAALLMHAASRMRSALIAGLLLLSAGLLYAQQWDEELLYVSYTNFRNVEQLDRARRESAMSERFKGYQDVFAINWVNGRPYFFINGYNSIPLNNPSEKIVGALSSYYAPRTGQGLVLGLGSGATASVVGQLFEHTDVVEINPVVRENLFRMKQWNFNIESNPRVNIIVDDAIYFTKSIDKQYDLILNTVTTPLYFSSSKLYTSDFFDVVKQRLKPDGIYVTWMDARVGDTGVDIILNTIKGSFKHAALLYVKSSYFLLICSDQPIRAGDLQQFKAGH
ncbi:MAG: spermine synthase, partial [Mariprofundus sp.]